MSLKRKIAIIVFVSLLTFAIDQIIKLLVVRNFPAGIPVPIVDDFLRITLIFNPNTAFGISLGQNFPYTVVAGAISVFVLIMALMEKNVWNIVAYSMILGGALGNIFDRIIRGEVVDFIDMGIGENLRWYVFNGADAFITIGIIMLMVEGMVAHLRGQKKD